GTGWNREGEEEGDSEREERLNGPQAALKALLEEKQEWEAQALSMKAQLAPRKSESIGDRAEARAGENLMATEAGAVAMEQSPGKSPENG
ncbi:unnamed protein product, partial [Discosporangium mesarthrocarpum]